ncbi:MAG: integration host factor subunit beta [Methylovulum sp.]|nr:integration host factor subunit beta [Methylovulum sp.]
MVKSELVRALNEKLPDIQLDDVESAVNCLLKHMADALVQGQRIEIRGFGGFDLHHRAPHSARNPMTGEAVQLPAKVVLHFKPGSATRNRVQKLFLLQRKKPSVSPDESRGLNKERP